MPKEQKIATLVSIVAIGFVTAVIFHYCHGAIGRLGYPYNTFLCRPEIQFSDFYYPLYGSIDRDPYNPTRIHLIGGYLPFGYFVAFLFSLIQPWQMSFFFFLVGLVSFLVWYIGQSLHGGKELLVSEKLNVYVLALMSYPVLFVLDRGNFDGLIFIFLALFAYFYQRGRHTLATLLLAWPIAMKGYPLVLLAIPIMDKRFLDSCLALMLTAMLEITSLALFKEGLFTEFGKLITSLVSACSIAFESGDLVRFNSSLYTLIIFLKPALVASKWFNYGYTLTMVTIFLVIMTVMYVNNYPFWKKLLLVTLMMILFPLSSIDYRLLMLYPALMAFIAVGEPSKFDHIMIYLFGALLIPKAYLILQADVNIGIIINPILLMLMMIVTLISPQRDEEQFVRQR